MYVEIAYLKWIISYTLYIRYYIAQMSSATEKRREEANTSSNKYLVMVDSCIVLRYSWAMSWNRSHEYVAFLSPFVSYFLYGCFTRK